MAVVGASVIVTVQGFGSKQGKVNKYDRETRPMAPYHVVFLDGMSGWFSPAQVSFDTSAKIDQDPIANLADQLLSNPRPYTPHYYPPPGEEDEYETD